MRSTMAVGLVAGAVVAMVLAVGAWSGQPASAASGSIQSEPVADDDVLNVVGKISLTDPVPVSGTAGLSSTKAATTNPSYTYDSPVALRLEAGDNVIAGAPLAKVTGGRGWASSPSIVAEGRCTTSLRFCCPKNDTWSESTWWRD